MKRLILFLLFAPCLYAQGQVTGNGVITVGTSSGTGTPAYALNGAGGGISNDDLQTSDRVTSYHTALPNGTIAGNLVVIQLRYQTPAQTVTWTDNVGSSTYQRAIQCVDTPHTTVSEIWYVQGVQSGVFDIVPHFGSSTQFVQMSPFEFSNAGALDQATCQSTSGTTVAAPALNALTTSGDLIFDYAVVDSTQQVSSCNVGSQANISWKLRTAMLADKYPTCMQFGVYNSVASFSPTFTIGTSASFITAAAAFKPSGAGSQPPSGIRVAFIDHENTENEQDSSVTLEEPMVGNTMAVLFNSGCVDGSPGDCAFPTAVADGVNTYAMVGSTILSPNTDGGGSSANIWYAKGVTPGTYRQVWTMHARSSGGNGSTWIVYDIVGASTNPLDTTMNLASNTGDQTTTGPGGPLTALTATPGQTNEIMLTLLGLGWNTPTAFNSPSGAIFISSHYIVETNSSHADLNSGGGIYKNGASVSPVTFIYAQDESNFPGVGAFVSLAVAFH